MGKRMSLGKLTAILASILFCATSSASALKADKYIVHERGIDLPIYVYLPDRITGKIPAMLLVHGSGGLNLKAKEIYTSAFAAKGIATIFIDSFTPRGVKTTTEDQSSVDPIDMGKDALAALAYVADNVKEIDAANVGVMGFSKGGLVAFNLSLTVFNQNPKPLRFVRFIAMYPPCNGRRLAPKTIGPLTIISGEDDTYNSPRYCEEMALILQQGGSPVTFRKIPGAQHAWDVPGPAHVVRTGENYSNCLFEEVQPQVWIETHSKIKVFDHGKVATRKLALEKCLTHKASWGYSAKATSISMKYVEEEVEKLIARRR
jgi:dienelactone hydrolase